MTIPEWASLLQRSAGTRNLIPDAERTRSEQPVVNRWEQVTADTKEILHRSVDREKSLRVRGRLEPAHLALALADGLMGDFCSIVFVLPGTVAHGRHHGVVRRRVAAQLVRDQPARLAALSSQQLAEEPLGRPLIAPRLHEDVEYIAVFIDSTPQILLPASELDE